MYKLLLVVVTVAVVFFATPHAVASDDHKSILISGASTGIGRNLAETLAKNGYHVYAGGRKDKDLAALNAIDNVTAVSIAGTISSQPGFSSYSGSKHWMVVPDAEQQEYTIRTKVTELVQLNEWGQYSYSRDQLVALLDEAFSGEAPSE